MQTFNKKERLCNKSLIEQLFKKGSSISAYPFKLIWINTEDINKPINFNTDYPAKILISVSHRNFHKAVDRNKIKRLIREVYRKNKNILYDFLNTNNINCIFSVIYISKKILPYKEFENKILLLLQKLIKENVENIK
ncbi:MAG: ribonuclease P protein component [Bacteroidales bacterium]|nr:ribonuclease P protein component [Bacteroidales bacterium]